MDKDGTLRKVLLEALKGGHAYRPMDEITAALPQPLQGAHGAPDLPTPWQLLEHLRISQWDILEFSRNPDYASPKWPEGYWPQHEAPAETNAWDRSVAALQADLESLAGLVGDPGNDLLKPFPHGGGQTLAREAILAAVHNAYHLGQMVQVRKLLGAWPPEGQGS